MPDFSSLLSPAPYHIISYGTLLGATFFQSFIGGIVSFKALPRPQFATLQEKLVPVYFTLQTALPIALALTYPAVRAPPPLGGHLERSGIFGVLDERNRWPVLVPIAGMLVCNAANLLGFGPATTKVMRKRKHQETKDGKKSYDSGPHSQEMQALNKQFGILHGASAVVDLVAFLFMIRYGFYLASRLQ